MVAITSNGTGGGVWSSDEIDLLVEEYPENGSRELSKTLGRSEIAIRHKASRLGIKAYEGEVRARQSKKNRENARENAIKNGYKDMHAWKREVLIRDDYTCQECGLRNPLIVVVHHTIPINVDSSLKYDISNGRTLCPNCHALCHIELGRHSSGNRLTGQDKEFILELRAQGETIDGIATLLGINYKTVLKYITRERDYIKKGGD